MSQVHNYTVQDFQNLANQSADNAELRIRQSNQDISTTPLGFFAKMFKHGSSNAAANQAFMQTIINDPRYQEVAGKLQRTLSTMLPERQALTAAKVKTALQTAEQILTMHKQAKEVANKLVDLKIIPQSLKREFASFFISYQKNNPDKEIILNDFGDKSLLSPEQQQLPLVEQKEALAEIDLERMSTLADIMKEFYSQNNRLERSNLFQFQPEDCNGDAQKAQELTKLINNNSDIKIPQDPDDKYRLVESMFTYPATDNVPSKGSIFSYWKDLIHENFTGSAFSIQGGARNMLELDSEQIKKLNQSIPSHYSTKEKRDTLSTVLYGLSRFLKSHENLLKNSPKAVPDSLVDEFCKYIKNEKITRKDADNIYMKYAIKIQLENNDNYIINGENIFTKNGIDPEFGKKALNSKFFQSSMIDVLGKNITSREEKIKQIVQDEVNKFITNNAKTLKELSQAHESMPKKMPQTLINLGLPLFSTLTSLEGQKPSELTLINELNQLTESFLDPNLKDADRGMLLKASLDAFFAGKSEEQKIEFCQNNKPLFEKVIGQLADLNQSGNTLNPTTLKTVNDLNLFMRSLYAGMLNHLPNETAQTLLLNEEPAPANPQLAQHLNRNQSVKKIERDATPAAVFAAIKDTKSVDKTTNMLMEKLHCTDKELVKKIIDSDSLENILSSAWKSTNYDTKLYTYVQEIEKIGERIQELHKNFPEYRVSDLTKIYMDALVEIIPQEKLPQLYDALNSEISHKVFTVLMNHTNKEMASLAPGKTSTTVDNMISAFRALNYLANTVSSKLDRPSIGEKLFDSGKDLTMRDLPFQPFLGGTLARMFPGHLSHLDGFLFDSKDKLTNNEYNNFKNFFNNLPITDRNGQPKTMGEITEKLSTSFKNTQNQTVKTIWEPKDLALIFAFHAREISDLISLTNGLPDPKDLWNILHGGKAPEDLTLENFSQKLMNQLAREFDVYKTIAGLNYLDLSTFISAAKVTYGISPSALMQKMANSLDTAPTIDFTEQKMHDGMFTIGNGSQYKNGSEAYGFALDFYRAGMPLGAQGPEGNKITVVANGENTDFTMQEYKKMEEEASKRGEKYSHTDHPLIQNLVNTVRPLCSSNEQLAGVGLCTSQNVQGALGVLKGGIYKDVTGGCFEHCALDFTIQGLPNGHVQVVAKEKPGSLFTLRMQLDVDQAGNITVEQGSVSYASLNTFRAVQEANLAGNDQ
ncbi:MAG: hypothetical protein IJU76_16015 [Desulfovibrionaceae bacterium]|nr:hypothetical protein [Desulfovibrionaceae bacterium]